MSTLDKALAVLDRMIHEWSSLPLRKSDQAVHTRAILREARDEIASKCSEISDNRYQIAKELYREFVDENPYRTNFMEWLEEKNASLNK